MMMPVPTTETPEPKKSGIGRLLAVAAVVGVVVCLVLWMMAFSIATSMMVGTGTTFVLIGAGSWSEAFEAVLDWLSGIPGAILAAIAAVFAALFSLLGL